MASICWYKKNIFYVLYDGTNVEDVAELLNTSNINGYEVRGKPGADLTITLEDKVVMDLRVGDYITADMSEPIKDRAWAWSPKAFNDVFICVEDK